MTGSLDGRVALVTGASSGIGEAAAIALAAAGAHVAMSARRADRLDVLVQRIETAGGKALALPGDVADEAAATAAVARTIAHFGRIDILVNSAGIIQASTIEHCDTTEFRRVMDVNLMGTLYTCKAVIAPMKAQGGGDIINISSQAARKVAKILNSYSTSKFALSAMTEAMRQEVGGYGIRVCQLLPGATKTEVAGNISDPAMRTAMTAHVGKDGSVEASEIADAIVFVAALPRHVNVDLISIRPTSDTAP